MILSVWLVLVGGREGGGVDTPSRRVIKSRYSRKPRKKSRCRRSKELSKKGSEPYPYSIEPNRLTRRSSCYTFAKKSSCAFPNTRCADRPPNLFAWQASPVAARGGGGGGGGGEGGGLHSLYFICIPIPSHRIPPRNIERERESIKKQRGRFRVIELDIIDARHCMEDGIAGRHIQYRVYII